MVRATRLPLNQRGVATLAIASARNSEIVKLAAAGVKGMQD